MKIKAQYKTLIEIHKRKQMYHQLLRKCKKMKKKMNRMKKQKKKEMMREIQSRNKNQKQ